MPRKHLTWVQRRSIVDYLLKRSKNGRAIRGDINELAMRYNVHRNTISRLWVRQTATNGAPDTPPDIQSRIRGNSGRKGYDLKEIAQRVQRLPWRCRQTLKGTAIALHVHPTVIKRAIKAKLLVKR